MKLFNELTNEQKKAAEEKELITIIREVAEGTIIFNGKLGDEINNAVMQAEKMQTPWFAHEYIMRNAYCRDSLQKLAKRIAAKACTLKVASMLFMAFANIIWRK